MEYSETVDASRESTERVAPFSNLWVTDNTFLAGFHIF